MSDVASLKLCKELHELSGWDCTAFEHLWNDQHGEAIEYAYHEIIRAYPHKHCPAYDAGYLLRRLPPRIVLSQRAGNSWDADCYCGKVDGKEVVDTSIYKHADTPEDALTLLAIELFKLGILPTNKDKDRP